MATTGPAPVPTSNINPILPPPTKSPDAVNPAVASVPTTAPTLVPRSQIDRAPAPVVPGVATGTSVTSTNSVPLLDITTAAANVTPASVTGNIIIPAVTRPGGNTGAIQFNNNSTFAGRANLTFDGVKIQSIGYGVPLLTTMYDSLAGGILNATGEVRVGNINTNASATGSAGLGRLRYQRSGPVPGGAAGQVAFYGFKAKDNQFVTLTFENNNLSSVALVMGATAPYDASGVPGYVGYGGNSTVFGISGTYFLNPGGANQMSSGGASENWRPFLNLDGRANLIIGGGITMAPPDFRPWFTTGGQSDPYGTAVNCGITFADGTFQNTAYQGASPVGATVNIREEGVAVVSSNTINFVGPTVTASNVSGIATVTVSAISGISVTDEGFTVIPSANAINFTGAGVTASNVSGVATITIPGGNSISGITVQEEGSNVVATANTVNFVGSLVAASNVSGVATVTVKGPVVQEEGSNVVANTDTFNFIGNLVTASNVGGVATVTVKGPAVQEEGSNVVANTDTLNFVGTLVTASNVAGVATVTVNGPAVQEEGSNVVASTSTLNFVGAGVTASNVGGVATVTIPGSVSGTVSTLTGNITLNSTYVSGTILKWVNGDILITAPGTANGAIPVGSTINIFNASQTGNANIFADFGNAVLVGPRPNAEGILTYVSVHPFEQVTLVNLGPSAGNVSSGTTMWFCYGSAYPLGVAYP